MNQILTPEHETIVDDDARIFYGLMSTVTGQNLDFQKDRILIKKPSDPSQNSRKYLILCEINGSRVVGIKRCMDNPEYLRREVAVDNAKRLLGFPSYAILTSTGISLRGKSTGKNCMIFEGWESKELLVIDFGNLRNMKKMKDLDPQSVSSDFYYEYGMWAAFNFILGVVDRHESNFILSFTDKILHSIDNELGPFDSRGNRVGIRQIIVPIKQNIERFFDDLNRPVCIQALRKGFAAGWDKTASRSSELSMFNETETQFITSSAVLIQARFQRFSLTDFVRVVYCFFCLGIEHSNVYYFII